MTFSLAHRNAMLDFAGGTATWASLHSADPGETGASEASGGGYARVALSWGSAGGGSLVSVTPLTFTVPAGTWTHVGYWSSNTGGTFKGSSALTPPVELAGAGDLTVSSIVENLGECP